MSSVMDVGKVERLIGLVSDAIVECGANLLESHQALKSVDAVVVRYIREGAESKEDADRIRELLK